MSNPKYDRSFRMVAFISVVMLLLVVYIGSYCALVGETPRRLADPYDYVRIENGQRADHYRFGGEPAEYFYWPINQIDRLIRRDYWASPFNS